MQEKTPQAVQSCHDLILWMLPQLDKFPRVRRFTLGERIENRLLITLEDLVEAAYSRQKKQALNHANRQLGVLRHLWRLAFELRIIEMKSYEHGTKLINGVGQQVGGWLKTAIDREITP